MNRRHALLATAAVAVSLGWWLRCGPLPAGFLDLDRFASLEVVDRTGKPLYESPSPAGGRVRFLTADRLPEALVAATLAAEDRRFFSHPGLDPVAIVRAGWRNARALRVVEGGSTLTQQTVKLLSGRSNRGLAAKLREAVLALRLEYRLSKREILSLYLNLAPYANQAAGAEAASRVYFGLSADALTPAQAAFLAGLPQRPSRFNPRRAPALARARQLAVLDRMSAIGKLGAPELARARAERLSLLPERRPFVAPHFVERALAAVHGRRLVRIETTLDADLQRQVLGILRMHRERLDAAGARNVAVAVLKNDGAEWLAWEGSGAFADLDRDGSIDGVTAPRQPGSALKPFTYALAFERGLSPASVLPDVPSSFPTAETGVVYTPRNYDGAFRGPLRARLALAGSENVPAVALLARLGVPDLLRFLRRAGLTTLDKTGDHYGLALTMGDAEVRLDELVAAYAALANGGIRIAPRALLAAVERPDRRSSFAAPGGTRIVSAQTAHWIADILNDAEARAYIFGSGGSLEFPFPVAAKTGTSTAYRDNWTLGFTRSVTVGVWVGNFDRQELRNSSGVTGAAPIFHDVMLAAEARYGNRSSAASDAIVPRPDGLAPRQVCALSGQAATEACPRVVSEWLPRDRRLPACGWHQGDGVRVRVAWPAEYRDWARDRGLLTPAEAARRASRDEAPAFRIASPPRGATYLLDPTLRAEFQMLPLRVVADAAAGSVHWKIDGRAWGSATPAEALHWPMTPGSHSVVASDQRGRSASATILVR